MPKTILVVEDNDLNTKLFRTILEAYGYHVIHTENGVAALSLARQHRPDLILMNIQLPDVSGTEVTKWMKAAIDLRSIPIIAVTAFATSEDEVAIRESGCDGYIPKPISVGSFIETIEQFLGPLPKN
jgi:two-component system, cell cycle response regulator DivK